MKITSVHICEYSFDDLCQLVDRDLEIQGLRRTNKTPVSRTVEGKETWVFEATSTGGPGPGPIKPKGKGGRPKKVVTYEGEGLASYPAQVPVKEEAGVVASSGAPFRVHPQKARMQLRQVG